MYSGGVFPYVHCDGTVSNQTCSISVCTPVGFSRMFTVMGQLVIKPQVLVLLLFELSRQENLHSGCLTRSNTNQHVQLHGLARVKVWI